MGDLGDALRRSQSKPLRDGLARFLPVFRRAEAPPLVWRRSWHPDISYEPGDVVEHNDSSYVAALPSKGVEPPDLPWDVLARGKRGAGGISGANGAPGPAGPPGPPGANTVSIEDENVALGIFTAVNFVGAGVTATDAGGGQADVTIPGGGGAVTFDAPVESQFGDANSAGSGTDSARSNHVHDRHDDAVLFLTRMI